MNNYLCNYRFNMNTKTMKYDANVEPLKTHGSDEASNSNKPTKFMFSSFAPYSTLKFRQHVMETITENADKVLIKDDDLPLTSMNPINFKVDEDLLINFKDDEDLIKEKKRKGKSIAIINDEENLDVLDQDWVPSKASPNKSQIKNINFLREAELEDFEGGKGIELKLIQPSLEVINLTLAKWNMRKNNGRITSSYVLRSSSWKKVTKTNQLT
ncbi:hypothetical protein Lal_00040233 [Lupinus albus]|nr:hypothetical protein Lal_00040233 [Lupinus albus]